ncbi:MAG: hypothetical protein P8J45_00355 [Phycisphaerales bacterium]|nr:hypothetical protein [Phycisphaerales bacterium]
MNPSGLPILLALLVLPIQSSLASDPPPADLLRGPDVGRVAKDSNLGMLDNGVFLRSIRRTAVAPKRWFLECESLALTPGQLEQITALKATFNQRSQAYLDQHQPRIKALRKRLKAMETAAAAGEEQPPEYLELLAERARLVDAAPQVTVLQQAVWSLLKPLQQDNLRSRLEAVREAIRREQAIERLKEQARPLPEAMQGEMQGEMQGPSPAVDPPAGQPGRLPASLDGFD